MRKVDFIVLMMLLLCLSSCTGDKIPSGIEFGSAPARSLNTGTTSLSFGAEDNLETTMNVECENVSWGFANVPDWLSLSPSSGRTSSTITVRAQSNTTVESRFATIQLRSTDTNYSYSKDITVSQSAGLPTITPSKTTLAFGCISSSDTISIISNVEWTVECSASWVTATKVNSTELHISVTENHSSERSSIIYINDIYGNYGYPFYCLATINVIQYEANTFKVGGVSFKMIKVDGGTFTMGATSEQGGDAYSDEVPTHSVTLSDYYIGETEVTQELWEAVMGWNPSYFKDSMRPVENVTWYECQNFIERLNEKTGQKFRLPTEAEWEYAARGRKSEGFMYAGSNNIDEVAWYDVNSYDVDSSSSEFGTHNVGTKKANDLGLYDMSGNVWEWCQDWYGSYSSNNQTNPTGASSGSIRVYRGGSWYDNARFCRVSFRDSYTPGASNAYLGLRLAL